MRICKISMPLFAASLGLALVGCSSVKAEKGPFRDDDGFEPGTGSPVTGGATTGAGGASSGGTTGVGGTTSGTGGGGGGGTSSGGPPGCQKFDYRNYEAPAAKLTLKADILPIFANTATSACTASSCHSNTAPNPPKLGPANGMVDNAGIEAIRNALLAPSEQVPSLKLVSPGKPEESYLMHKIDGSFGCMGFACQTAAGCGVRMPQLLPQLDADKVNKVRDWIKQGAAAM